MTREPRIPSDAIFMEDHRAGMHEVPRAWAHMGERLVHSFEVLADARIERCLHSDLREQALMLAGMAIEVMLKAVILNNLKIQAAANPDAIPDLQVWRRIRTHVLAELANDAQVDLSQEQIDVAAALTEYITWRGRYVVPLPSRVEDLYPAVLTDGLVGQPHQVATIETARDLIWHVIAAVKARLYAVA